MLLCGYALSYWPVEVAEAKALAVAVKLGRRYRFEDVIIVSDWQSLMNRLSKGATYFSNLDSILDDILCFSISFTSIRWSHVKRDGNCVAHHLARLVPFGIEQLWKNHYPSEISPYVLMDSLSLD